MKKWLVTASLTALAIGISACQLPANVAQYVQGSGPGGSDLTGHTITNGATTITEYELSGSGTTVSAYADPTVDSNEREAFWYTGSPVAQDEESCSTWDTSPGLTQQGEMLHMTQDANGVVHGIAVVDNIWMGGKWIINIYGVTGDGSGDVAPDVADIQEGFTPSGLGDSLDTMPPLPWHMCARTVGTTVEFVVWTGSNPEPAYGTPGAGGQADIPVGYQDPGIAGWWVGHLPPASTATMSDLSTS